MRIAHFVAACSLVLAPSLAAAQPTAAPPRPAEAAQVSEGEIALALQLVDLADMRGAALAGVGVMLDQQVEMQPELAPFRNILEDWAKDVFTSQEAADGFARLYAETFTEGELRDMVAFFRSPTGRRMASEQASISARAEEIGQQLAESRSEDLLSRLTEAMGGEKPR
jgi:uncharacterized protein